MYFNCSPRTAITCLSVLFLAGCALMKGTRSEDGFMLQYRLPEQQAVEYDFQTSTLQKMEVMGQQMEIDIRSAMLFSLNSNGLKEEVNEAKVTIDSMFLSVKSPRGDISPNMKNVVGKSFASGADHSCDVPVGSPLCRGLRAGEFEQGSFHRVAKAGHSMLFILPLLGIAVLTTAILVCLNLPPRTNVEEARHGCERWIGLGIGIGVSLGTTIGMLWAFVLQDLLAGFMLGPTIGTGGGMILGAGLEARFDAAEASIAGRGKQKAHTAILCCAGIIALLLRSLFRSFENRSIVKNASGRVEHSRLRQLRLGRYV